MLVDFRENRINLLIEVCVRFGMKDLERAGCRGLTN